MTSKIKVTVSPEALERFEGNEEELKEIARQIAKIVASGNVEDLVHQYDDLFDTNVTSINLQ